MPGEFPAFYNTFYTLLSKNYVQLE